MLLCLKRCSFANGFNEQVEMERIQWRFTNTSEFKVFLLNLVYHKCVGPQVTMSVKPLNIYSMEDKLEFAAQQELTYRDPCLN
jgi:hypothetical protein